MTMKRFKNEKFNKMAEIDHAFKAEAAEEKSDITIYGDIGESWWGESTSASDVEKALKNITSDVLNVHLNSGGGDAFDGIAIYNQLKKHPAKVVVHVEGLAASAASLIAMAGDEVFVNTGAMIMIHEASTFSWGTKADIRKTLNALEGIDKSIADIYMTRFKGEREEIDTMITNETWMTADEAVALGFADEERVVEPEADPEEFKNKVLARFKRPDTQSPIAANASSNKNILSRFKRDSQE